MTSSYCRVVIRLSRTATIYKEDSENVDFTMILKDSSLVVVNEDVLEGEDYYPGLCLAYVYGTLHQFPPSDILDVDIGRKHSEQDGITSIKVANHAH